MAHPKTWMHFLTPSARIVPVGAERVGTETVGAGPVGAGPVEAGPLEMVAPYKIKVLARSIVIYRAKAKKKHFAHS